MVTDARGNTTDLYQYHTGVPADPVNDPASDYSDTHYTYDASGNRTGEKDAAGNTWSWTYDLLGNQITASDPDTGTSHTTYDGDGNALTQTDARGKQVTTSYDADGRTIATYDTTGGVAPAAVNQTGAWTYDTLKKGLLTASTSYQKGTTSPSVTNTVLNYNNLGLPGTQRENLGNLPAAEAALAPAAGYEKSETYTAVSGLLATRGYAAAGGLPAEAVNYGYDTYGQPTSVASNSSTVAWNYVAATGYDEFGDPLQYTMGGGSNWVDLTMTYDQQTHRLTDAKTTDVNSPTVVDDTKYAYSDSNVSAGAGLVTSTTDQQNSGDAQRHPVLPPTTTPPA